MSDGDLLATFFRRSTGVSLSLYRREHEGRPYLALVSRTDKGDGQCVTLRFEEIPGLIVALNRATARESK
jgi:hypothetical protein